MNKAEINMDEYLELLEIKKDFDKKLSHAISDYDVKKTSERNILSTEKYSLKLDLIDLKTKNTKQMFQIQILKHELETIKNKWYYKLFDSKRTLH